MSVIRLGPFEGANLAIRPKLLPPNVGVQSLNHWPDRGDLRPWRVPLLHTAIAAGRKTIHMLPRKATTDPVYWLEWSTEVHAIGGLKADDTTMRTYYSGSGPPKVTNNVIGLAGAPFPTAYRDLGVPKPATQMVLTETAAGTGDDETRYYAYTYLTNWDEEGPPNVSAPVTCKPGATFSITGMALAPTGAGETRGINRIRIYRTVAGSDGAAFYFLRDIPIATSSADDARPTGADVCPSTLYAMPPADARCLTALWNGMAACISGMSVRYSEPFRLHAWPVAYETLCHDTPIALGAFEKSLLVLTTGRPRLVYGSAPEAMDDVPVEFVAGCVSSRSVVSMGHGVCWATSDGLAYVGKDGARLLTAGVLLQDDWQAMNPTTMVGCQWNGLYFCFYDANGLKGFCIDPLNPERSLRFISTGYSAAFYDPLGEKMYVLDGVAVKEWNAGASNMTVEFTSKIFRLPSPQNMAVAEVISDTYPLTFALYADDREPWEKVVISRDEFGLPGDYLADDYQIKVSTSADVAGVAVATSVEELRAL